MTAWSAADRIRQPVNRTKLLLVNVESVSVSDDQCGIIENWTVDDRVVVACPADELEAELVGKAGGGEPAVTQVDRIDCVILIDCRFPCLSSAETRQTRETPEEPIASKCSHHYDKCRAQHGTITGGASNTPRSCPRPGSLAGWPGTTET